MGATEKDEQKPKICRLAMIAFLIPTLSLIASCLAISCIVGRSDVTIPLYFLQMLVGSLVMLFPLLSLTSFVLGFVAIVRIARSKGLLKGYTFSILGILMAIWAFDSGGKALISGRNYAKRMFCQSNMKQLAKAMQQYSEAYNSQYPTPSKWCDLLFDFCKLRERSTTEAYDNDRFIMRAGFQCPHHYRRCNGRQASYAINPNCSPDSPADTVLLFEAPKGWNKFGGLEIMSFEHHQVLSILPFRRGKGCNVLFNNGHVEFFKPKELSKLKWKAGQGNK